MPYLIGIALAVAVCGFAYRIRLDRDGSFYPMLLAVIASYYVLFAAMSGSVRIATVETLIMVAFLLIAALGFTRNLWFIVAALAAHGVLDSFHGHVVPNHGVPAWWPPFCLAFDVVAALLLSFLLVSRRLRSLTPLDRHMLISRSSQAALLVAMLAGSAAAQDSTASRDVPDRAPTALELRSAVSFSLIQTRPQGALGQNIGLGYGLNGAYLFRLDRAGIWSIRADVGVVDYGNESKRAALSETVGGRVQVNVRTTNYIVPMSVGPQVMWPTGPFRPYVNAGIGGQAFFTESRVEGADDASAFAHTTNQSDFAASWVAGGGVYAPVYNGKTKVQLDLGVQYLNGGSARYLAPGSIVDLPNGQIRVSPSSSTTHLLVVRAGVRIGL